ncbi:MAG: hypothetical protein F4066_06085 [Chloroflexi bacterium]|nr:hypothetical protein [Chloroflexota bacterium]MYF81190.1 hypothetical protein [Chloroflexota bacterium]MYI04414.1 hypothetical protein [Chloroflexota bacterium]
MRAVLLLLVTTAIALGVLLVGCGGDEQPAQSTQQQAQTQQESAAQDEADAAERSTSSAQTSVGEAAQDEQTIAQDAADSETSEFSDPQLAEAAAALEAWAADLETMVLDAGIEFNLFGLESRFDAVAIYRAEPLGILTTVDASALFGAFQALSDTNGEQGGDSLTLQLLLLEDDAYMSMTGLGGWVDLSDAAATGFLDIGDLPGGDLAALADPAGLDQTLWCVETVGGVVSDAEHEGEAVWLVECEIDVASLTDAAAQALRAQGIDPFEAGAEVMRMRIAISRSSGAPLWVEVETTLADPFALNGADEGDEQVEASSYITSLTTLRSWNEPVELPTPEPLVDPSLLDSFFGEDTPVDSASNPGSDATFAPSELLEADELLALATEWLNTVDELHVQIEAQAVAAGESRTASTRISTSWSRGMFEVTTILDQAHIFGVLWTRDGIWVGEGRADEFSYQASTPELQGFAGLTVDEFLALPDLYNFGSYASALDLSWLTRTIEGGGPPIYELVIESGPRLPGDDYFDELGELIKAEASEFLADSASIESIEYYSTVITINGASGEIVSQVTIAEFQSNAVDVLFTASIIPFAGGPIEFSIPPD